MSLSEDENTTPDEWKPRFEKFVTDNLTDYSKLKQKRGALAGQLTQACSKSQKLYDKTLKQKSFYHDDIEGTIVRVKHAAARLQFFCTLVNGTFSEAQQQKRPEEYEASKIYFAEYEQSAKAALAQMRYILQHGTDENPLSSARPSADLTSQPSPSAEFSNLQENMSSRFHFDEGQDGELRGFKPMAPMRTNMSTQQDSNGLGLFYDSVQATDNPIQPSQQLSQSTLWREAPVATPNQTVGGESQLIALMSKSLAGSFNIKTFVPIPFNGSPAAWPEFRVRWEQADRVMALYGYTNQARFLLLIQSLVSTPLVYLRSLPLSEPQSYVQGMSLLISLYEGQQSRLRQVVKKFLASSKCAPTFSSRSAFHSNLMSYKHAVTALNASAADVLLCVELLVTERCLDSFLLREFTKSCERRRDTNSLLGFKCSFDFIVQSIYSLMLTDQKIQSHSATPNQSAHPRVRFRGTVNTLTDKTNNSSVDNNNDEYTAGAQCNAAVAGQPIKRAKNIRKNKLSPVGLPQQNNHNDNFGDWQRSNRPTGAIRQRSASAERTDFRCPFCYDTIKRKNLYPHRYPTTCVKLWKEPKLDPRIARKIILDKRLCRLCFKSHGPTCPSPPTTKCRRCEQRHNMLFCDKPENFNPNSRTYRVNLINESPHRDNKTTILPIITALAVANGIARKVRILADSGAGIFLIRKRVANLLGLTNGTPCSLNLQVVSGKQIKQNKQRKVSFELRSLDQKFSLGHISAITTDEITGPLDKLDMNDAEMSFLNEQGFPRNAIWPQGAKIDILLESGTTLDILQPPIINFPGKSSYKLLNTALGPALIGKTEKPKITQPCMVTDLANLSKNVENFFSMESLGIREQKTSMSTENEQCLKLMREITYYSDTEKVYYTGILWKRSPYELKGNNFQIAKQVCLSGRKRALRHNLIDKLETTFMEKVISGCTEKIPENEIASTPNLYISCHPVFKEASLTTQVRLVYNCSAVIRESNLALNDIIFQGNFEPNNTPHIIMRTRVSPIIVLLDLQKSYWNVKIHEKDRNMLRHVYIHANSNKLEHYRSKTLIFGLASAGYQSQYCILDLAERFKSQFPLAARFIKLNLYVDDIILNLSSMAEAREAISQVTALLRKASMLAHKWNSSHPDTLVNIPDSLKANVCEQKILGTSWARNEDYFFLDNTNILDTKSTKITRRSILSQASRLFDVMGFLQPFTLLAKLILKQCWQLTDLSWDSEVPDSIKKEWQEWCGEVPLIPKFKIPRYIQGATDKRYLFIFGDASKYCSATVAYIVTNKDASILMSRTKLSPLKSQQTDQDVPLTVVRLEQLATLMSARLKDYILEAFPENYFQDYFIFTDSLVVLKRLKANKPHLYRSWTSSRITETLKRIKSENIFFVNGQANPADVCSRGCKLTDLLQNTFWLKPPHFVFLPKDKWPQERSLTRAEAQKQNELDKKEFLASQVGEAVNILVTTRAQAAKQKPVLEQQEQSAKRVNRFSSKTPRSKNWVEHLIFNLPWNRAVRTCAYILRFLYIRFRQFTVKLGITPLAEIKSYLTVPELRQAQLLFIKYAQNDAFGDQLTADKRPKQKTLLDRLAAFTDNDGILHAKTRLCKSEILPDQTTNPIILPKHHVTQQIILNYHVKSSHCSHATTQYQIQRQYLIIGGRQTVRQALYKCPKRHCLKPKAILQSFAPLPPERLGGNTALVGFQFASLDFAGPFLTKHRCSIPDCQHEKYSKVHVALYSCFQTRACHLELMHDLTTKSFIQSLIRFISRRGKPTLIYTDNATQVKAGEREIKKLYKAIEWKTVNESAAERGITFEYSLPAAQFQNGISERLIKSLKRSMKINLGNAMLTFIELQTAITEIEAQINNRPLITPSSGIFGQTVTPAQLTIGRNLEAIPDTQATRAEQLTDLTKYQAHRKFIMNHFTKRWKNDYLLSLQVSRFHSPKNPLLKPGTPVLLRDDESLKKDNWKLAVVERAEPSPSDGLIRTVQLKTPKGTIYRHISKISLLEGHIA